MARTCGAFSILTWKRASRHNRMHFFNISTSKSAPDLKCFVHFDLEMCFAPQHRALFQHFNFKKHFWLRNVLRATTAYTFSTSQLPKMLDVRCFSFFTSQCASCYNGVQFFISHPARWLRTRGFSEPTFRPSGATNRCKNRVFCDFSTFSRACNFFLLTLSSDSFSSLIFSDRLSSFLFYSLFFSSLLFSSLLFSDSSHLCCSSVHMVGSLTSKLPSVIYIYIHIYLRVWDLIWCFRSWFYLAKRHFFSFIRFQYIVVFYRERDIYIYTYNRWFIVSWFHTVTPLDLFYREAAAMVRIALIAWDHSGEMQCHKPTRGW